jgi:hypothetical protein
VGETKHYPGGWTAGWAARRMGEGANQAKNAVAAVFDLE